MVGKQYWPRFIIFLSDLCQKSFAKVVKSLLRPRLFPASLNALLKPLCHSSIVSPMILNNVPVIDIAPSILDSQGKQDVSDSICFYGARRGSPDAQAIPPPRSISSMADISPLSISKENKSMFSLILSSLVLLGNTG